MEATLFEEKEMFTRLRPTKVTEAQKKAFIKEKAQEIIHSDWSNSDADDVESDLYKIFPFSDSGFNIAKRLDRHTSLADYEIDVEFVIWLDSLNSDYCDIIRENEKMWVIIMEPKPLYKIGDRIVLTETLRGIKGLMAGEKFYIVSLIKSEAKYVIHYDKAKTEGSVFAYEVLELCSNLIEN